MATSTHELEQTLEANDGRPTKGADDMIPLAAAASQLYYSTSGLRKIVARTKSGRPGAKIQFFQIGSGHIKFRQEWLDEFVRSNSIGPDEKVTLRKTTKSRNSATTKQLQIETHWSLGV